MSYSNRGNGCLSSGHTALLLPPEASGGAENGGIAVGVMIPPQGIQQPWLPCPGGRTLESNHPDEATTFISDAYSPTKLDVRGRPSDFALRMRLTELPGLNLGQIRFGTDVTVTGLPPSCYIVCLTLAGSLKVSSHRDEQFVAGSSAAVGSGEVTFFENWSPDCELVSVRIGQAELEHRLTQLTGRPPTRPIRFKMGLDLASSGGAPLLRALRLLCAESADPHGLLLDPFTAASLGDLVTTSLLSCQPNNYSDTLHGPVKASPPPTIRAAQELMLADPMAVGSVGELALRVHSSIRSLEEGFRKHLGTSPMRYLREVRLSRARDDLLLASPQEITVGQIAHRWGFRHLSRFAHLYRATFGEFPAETLRTGR